VRRCLRELQYAGRRPTRLDVGTRSRPARLAWCGRTRLPRLGRRSGTFVAPTAFALLRRSTTTTTTAAAAAAAAGAASLRRTSHAQHRQDVYNRRLICCRPGLAGRRRCRRYYYQVDETTPGLTTQSLKTDRHLTATFHCTYIGVSSLFTQLVETTTSSVISDSRLAQATTAYVLLHGHSSGFCLCIRIGIRVTDQKHSENANIRQGRPFSIHSSSTIWPVVTLTLGGGHSKSNRLVLLELCPTTPQNLVRIWSVWVIMLTDRQTDRQTDKRRRKHNLLGGRNCCIPLRVLRVVQ